MRRFLTESRGAESRQGTLTGMGLGDARRKADVMGYVIEIRMNGRVAAAVSSRYRGRISRRESVPGSVSE